jgi:hypothetical protein
MIRYVLAVLTLTTTLATSAAEVIIDPAPPVVVVRRHRFHPAIYPAYPIYPGAVVQVRIGRRPWLHHRAYYTERIVYR